MLVGVRERNRRDGCNHLGRRGRVREDRGREVWGGGNKSARDEVGRGMVVNGGGGSGREDRSMRWLSNRALLR